MLAYNGSDRSIPEHQFSCQFVPVGSDWVDRRRGSRALVRERDRGWTATLVDAAGAAIETLSEPVSTPAQACLSVFLAWPEVTLVQVLVEPPRDER